MGAMVVNSGDMRGRFPESIHTAKAPPPHYLAFVLFHVVSINRNDCFTALGLRHCRQSQHVRLLLIFRREVSRLLSGVQQLRVQHTK